VDPDDEKYGMKDLRLAVCVGAGAVAGLVTLLTAVSRMSRWRGKRNQKKRTPEAPGFSLTLNRRILGRRKYLLKYVA
jgi:hypothetical protein